MESYFSFAPLQKSGVDPAAFLDIITSTSMNSPAYKNYGRMILEKTAATFPLKLGMKDVELALQAGNDTAVPLPLAALLKEQHLAAIAHGYGDKDWASLGNYSRKGRGFSRDRPLSQADLERLRQRLRQRASQSG